MQKEDEMGSLVGGANFLLRAMRDEAFTFKGGKKEFVALSDDDLYPYRAHDINDIRYTHLPRAAALSPLISTWV